MIRQKCTQKTHHVKILLKQKFDHSGSLFSKIEETSSSELGLNSVVMQLTTGIATCIKSAWHEISREIFHQNINLIIAETYSDDFNKIISWKGTLNCISMQFPTRVATSIKKLLYEYFYYSINLKIIC